MKQDILHLPCWHWCDHCEWLPGCCYFDAKVFCCRVL